MEVKSQISWDFQGQTLPKNNKKMADFVGIFRAVSLEIDHFSADKTSVFNVSLTEINRSFFRQQYTLQKWTRGKAFNIMASTQVFAT